MRAGRGAAVAKSRSPASLSPDGHYVCKTIRTEGRSFVERVRLFEPGGDRGDARPDAGVTVRRRFGDYDASPMQPGSPRTILVGQAA